MAGLSTSSRGQWPSLVALADDATGALEVGAQFAEWDVDSVVSFNSCVQALPTVDALVIDTETRHLSAKEAFKVVLEIAERARAGGVRHIFKKTDSTLRGNIPAELSALISALPEQYIAYAPAYPSLGRVVRSGRVYVNDVPLEQTAFAQDPLNPIRDSSVLKLLSSDSHQCASIRAGESNEFQRETGAAKTLVFDAETDADLDSIASALCRDSRPHVAAGTGAFAAHWIRHVDAPRRGLRRELPKGRALVIAGSRHPNSEAQVQYACQRGAKVFQLAAASIEPSVAVAFLAGAIAETGWAILAAPPGTMNLSPPEVTDKLGSLTAAVMMSTSVEALIILGGDTTISTVRALGIESVRPYGELLDGVPASIADWHGRPLCLVTKAGGFGGPETLTVVRQFVEKS